MTTLRTALREQSPSLTLQRAAADEIARLDALVRGLQSVRPSEGRELPPLPPMTDLGDAGASNYGYSEDDMRAYAVAALEREQYAQPLTQEQVTRMLLELNATAKADSPSEMFAIIVRAVEQAHGIGEAQPPVQGSQP